MAKVVIMLLCILFYRHVYAIPCCREVYYNLYRRFFWLLSTPEGRGVSLTDEQIAMYQEYFPQPVPAAVSFEVRSAADMKEFMNLMFGKGWDMDTGAGEDMEASR